MATFEELTISEVAEDVYLKVSCEDEGDFYHMTMSPKFNIHSYPETGLLKKTDSGFSYKGIAAYIEDVLTAFQDLPDSESTPVRLRRREAADETSKKVQVSKSMMEFWPEF